MVKFLIFAVFLLKSHIWEKSKNDKEPRFFEFWYRFMEIKSWLKNIGVGWSVMGVATLVSELQNRLNLKK